MITAKKKNDEPTTSVDKHKVWLIGGISVAILAIAILILFPMFTGETGLAGKAIIQPENLFLHYSFDESPVNDLTKDSGKKSIDGTVNGATWDVNGYFKFDGENDNIGLGNIDYSDLSKMTVSAWFNKKDTNTDTNVIFGNRNGAFSFQLSTKNNNVSFDLRQVEGLSSGVASASSYNPNELNHVVGVYDGNNVKVYLNGVETVGPEATGDVYGGGDRLTLIGMSIIDGGPQSPFNGIIDDVKMWNSVLTPEEICTEAGKNWDSDNNVCGGSCGDCGGKICIKNKCVNPILISYYSFVENNANNQQYANKNGVVNGAIWIPNQMKEIEVNLVDGDMDASDTSAWGKGQATFSKVLALPKDGNALSIKRDGLDGSFYARQSVLEHGKDYHITGYARGDDSSAPRVMKQGKTLWQGTSSTEWQYFDFSFTSHPTDDRIFLYGNNGKIGDTVQFDDITITEVGGGYFEFDGVDDNIDFGVIDYSDYSQMTVSAWFNKEDIETDMIFSNHKGGGYSFQLGTDGNKVRFHFINDNGDLFGVVSDDAYNLNELNHVVGVYDGKNVKVYLNGVEKIGPEATGNINNYPDKLTFIGMGIDSEGDPQSPLNGIIDEVKLWKGALTHEQICTEAGKKWDPATISCVESSSSETDDDDNLETCSVDGITNYWKGEDNIDDVIGNFDGISKNNPGFTEGLIGKGFNFIKAQKQYLELGPTSEIVPEGSFSLVFWFKTDLNHPPYGGNEGRLIVFKQGSISAISTYLEKDNIAYLYKTGNGHKWVKYEKNYHDNQWHQYVLTYDGNTKLFTLYYDDENLGSSESIFEGLYAETPLLVGAYTNGERSFQGAIDEIAIFNRELTNDEILKFYNNGFDNGLGYCDESAVCDSDNLNLCDTKDSCTGATGYWYDDSTTIVKCYNQCPDGTSDDNDNVCEPVVVIVLGDVNDDDEINPSDAVKILEYAVDLITLTDDQLEIADVNCDGSVTPSDAVKILEYSVDLITDLDC